MGVSNLAEDGAQSWEERRRQWLTYVEKTLETLQVGRSIPAGPSSQPLIQPPRPDGAREGSTILLASPHPDDEALIGALPLRLRLEVGARVVNCAVTLGSDLTQRARRRAELESSCRVLGFDLIVPGDQGFDDVRLECRNTHPREWQDKVEALRKIFDQARPDAVFAPHAEDFNATHIGTHYLALDALSAHLARTGRPSALLIETEYWHEHSRPNLMVGVSPKVLALQIMATAEHGGEVSRNPYHLGLPARMMDNVRRGSEVVGGQGAATQPFPFAELYRITFMDGKTQIQPRSGGSMVGPGGKVSLNELRARFWPGNP